MLNNFRLPLDFLWLVVSPPLCLSFSVCIAPSHNLFLPTISFSQPVCLPVCLCGSYLPLFSPLPFFLPPLYPPLALSSSLSLSGCIRPSPHLVSFLSFFAYLFFSPSLLECLPVSFPISIHLFSLSLFIFCSIPQTLDLLHTLTINRTN